MAYYDKDYDHGAEIGYPCNYIHWLKYREQNRRDWGLEDEEGVKQQQQQQQLSDFHDILKARLEESDEMDKTQQNVIRSFNEKNSDILCNINELLVLESKKYYTEFNLMCNKMSPEVFRLINRYNTTKRASSKYFQLYWRITYSIEVYYTIYEDAISKFIETPEGTFLKNHCGWENYNTWEDVVLQHLTKEKILKLTKRRSDYYGKQRYTEWCTYELKKKLSKVRIQKHYMVHCIFKLIYVFNLTYIKYYLNKMLRKLLYTDKMLRKLLYTDKKKSCIVVCNSREIPYDIFEKIIYYVELDS